MNNPIENASEEDLREILDLLAAQDDYFVFQTRRVTYTEDWRDNMGEEECSECGLELIPRPCGCCGPEVYIWGEPLGQTREKAKASTHSVVRIFCCEEHFDAYTERWAEKMGFEEFARSYHH